MGLGHHPPLMGGYATLRVRVYPTPTPMGGLGARSGLAVPLTGEVVPPPK
jgi:hypothetical protein